MLLPTQMKLNIMAIPALNIPDPEHTRRPKPHLRVKKLRQWLLSLPTGNTSKATQEFVFQLEIINQSRYAVHDRIQLLDTLRPTARQLLLGLKQQTRKADIPLGQREREACSLTQLLLSAMATGYKIVVNDLIAQNSHKDHDELQLREAIYVAMQYLSRQLVEAYQVYAPEPAGVWIELHQLYQYAEENAMLILPLDDPYPDFSLPGHYTIDLAYKRILLLALAEPYHMMRGETDDIYYLVSAWTGACQILPGKNAPTAEEYAVDMASDKPPRFISNDMQWDAVSSRVIDLDEVKKRLDVHLRRMLRTSLDAIDQNEPQTLVERRQRDMLLRLAEAWHGALQRQTNRQTVSSQVRMATGLDASHYYISEGVEFTPEMDELRLLTDKIEPTLFATAYEIALQKDRYHLNRDFPVRPWWQNNASETGAALTCNADCKDTHVKVGEVVAYRAPEHPTSHWQIGVIRWLRSDPNDGIDMGIMSLASSAVPVAIKSLRGPGAGTDYFRGLLIPKQVSAQQTRSILVPSAVYDVHSELAINMKSRLFFIRLVSLQRATKEFSQFTFEVLEQAPINDAQNFIE
ncbi:MAG: hypothetical protein LJE74_06015 [Proteobacteria bacterium]|nr:hypothetical protein [Pseudomonadota bacterium]